MGNGRLERFHRHVATLGPALSAICIALASPVSAHASPTASLSSGFSNGTRLGEASLLTAKLEFGGSEYHGKPLPLSELKIDTPKGTVLSNAGLRTCPESVLEPSGVGPSGCALGSRALPVGSFTGYVAFAKEFVHEEGTAEVFLAPEGGVSLYLFGHEPVLLEVLAHGTYTPPEGAQGPGVQFSVPLIETVPGAAAVSLTSLSLPLGSFQEHEGAVSASVTAPAECSSSLSWHASARFADGEGDTGEAHAETTSACPGSGKRDATETRLEASAPAVKEGAADLISAKVTSLGPYSGTGPTGDVALYGEQFSGCMDVVIPLPEAFCRAESEVPGAHLLEAVYLGDEDFAPSAAEPAFVTVVGSEEEAAKRLEEAAVRRKGEEDALALKRAAEEAQARSRSAEVELAAVMSKSLPTWLLPPRKAGRIGALLRHGSYRVNVILVPAATLSISWTADQSDRGHRKRVVVANGVASRGATGTVSTITLTVKLTAAGRRLLEHTRALKVTAKGTLQTSSGAITRLRTFRLVR